jgi:hypothetical protein
MEAPLMGTLSELPDEVALPTTKGPGQALVDWWADADDDDRALLRSWIDGKVPRLIIAERLTAAGCPISESTLSYGIRRLARTAWES